MKNFKVYGNISPRTVLVHGGPGAVGEMTPVARELSKKRGVLEPLQTADSVDGQVEELKNTLEAHSEYPVVLIGHSWGAWLSWIVAARYPKLIKKLILISSGPFEHHYAEQLHPTRMSRLNDDERRQFENLIHQFNDPNAQHTNDLFVNLGRLCSKADSYDPIDSSDDHVVFDGGDIFRKVWPQADELRRNGELLNLADKIRCPIVAIHGDYDPHPAHGVQKPLSDVLKDFRFILLENCGHKPWIERQAKKTFYDVLEREVSS